MNAEKKIIDLSGRETVLGSLEVRLAETAAEIDAAQALRYRVFYDEMGAKPTSAMRARQRDFDSLDDVCDHLLVIDHAAETAQQVVGTYRLIRREAAAKNGSFYSSSEYDIAPLIAFPGEILELGRSCIAASHRTGRVMQVLWSGLAAYIFRYDITLMFGCASFPGTDPDAHAQALSYLYYHHLAPPALRARALPGVYVDMQRVPRETLDPTATFNNLKIDPQGGGLNLPPLLKGYLRVGGFVGDGAYLDHQFNTTDVCIVVKTDLITNRYMRHYERKEINLP
jgi:putative hemolysin